MINQIAAFLNVTQDQIKSVTEFTYVYNVVVFGRRARLVSKKVVKKMKVTISGVNLPTVFAGNKSFRFSRGTEGFAARGVVGLGATDWRVEGPADSWLDFTKENKETIYAMVNAWFLDKARAEISIDHEWLKAVKPTPKAFDLEYEMYNPNGRYYG